MPKKYIEREELLDNLKRFAPEHLTPLIVNLIQKQSTADVVELRHGKWIDGKCRHYKICSECNQIADFDFDYCPNCGAKMDGKD